MELQLLQADGTPAAQALVSIAAAPVSMPDLAMVADAAGRVSLHPPAAGRFVLRVWHAERVHDLPCDLAPGAGTLSVRLPG